MGIYGNLSNTAKTQFQFDRIYPNRLAMDNCVNTDGVYLGRYVLVEYDQDVTSESISTYYLINNKYYADATGNIEILYQYFSLVDNSTINYTNYENYFIKSNELYKRPTRYDNLISYYKLDNENSLYRGAQYGELIQVRNSSGELIGKILKCIGPGFNGEAVFEEVQYSNTENYTKNYEIDIKHYGLRQPTGAYSRAWDSTVWQKVIAGKESKYICIAELNASAPGLTFAYDAPTQTPLAPHFSSSSANNTYELHIQPSWGLRVKEAEDENYSDNDIEHIISTYNSIDDSISEVKQIKKGDIYFNRAGFNPLVSKHEADIPNEIKITATGKSGVKYYTHQSYLKSIDIKFQPGKQYFTKDNDNNYILYSNYNVNEEISNSLILYEKSPAAATDIQEISIHLPSIGNAVADFYDIVFSENRNRDTKWKYINDIPDPELGGMTRDTSTLAGTINDFHDAMGMIIKKCDEPMTQEEINSASFELIYYYPSTQSYYKKSKIYNYNNVDYSYEIVNTSEENYYKNYYYYVNSNTIYLDDNNNIISSVLEKDLGANTWDSNKIYFKKKINGFSYSAINDSVSKYVSNSYYYKKDNDYLLETQYKPLEERDYYAFDNSVLFVESQDDTFQSDKEYYVYDEDLKDYTLLTEYEIDEAIQGTIYESSSQNFKASYQANQFYYFESKTINDTVYQDYYYKLDSSFPYVNNRQYYQNIPVQLSEEIMTLYFPSEYFYFDEDDGTLTSEEIINKLQLDSYVYPTQGRYYWKINLGEPEWVYDLELQSWKQIRQIIYCERISNMISPSGILRYIDPDTQEISTIQQEVGKYYYQPKNGTSEERKIFTLITEEDVTNSNIINYEKNNFYFITTSSEDILSNGDLYCANKYYTYNANGLTLSHDINMNNEIKYYFLPQNSETNILNCMTKTTFYETSKYYYKIGDNFVLDNSNEVTQNRQYYKRNQYRIISDLLNTFSPGALWNANIPIIPCTIEIGEFTIGYTLKELVNFKTTKNTLLGQILSLNQMLDENNVIRTSESLQGIINISKDLNDKFEKDLQPNKILITDQTGRITTNESIDIVDIKNILTDTVTGIQYKLIVTNGELSIQPILS